MTTVVLDAARIQQSLTPATCREAFVALARSRAPAVNARGRARTVTVGRVKIERRPLLPIEAEIDDRGSDTFIQDDWHIRMMGARSEIRACSEIQIGEKLLGFVHTPGRPVGIRVDETIEER